MAVCRLFPVLLIASLAAVAARAQTPTRNLALHRRYTWSVTPNYALTQDPEDRIQLTDGNWQLPGGKLRHEDGTVEITDSRGILGWFWKNKTPVGWARTTPLFLTVDLGRDEPISGASFNAAAGHGEVEWPAALPVLVSSDGLSWHEAGDLVAAGRSQNGAAPGPEYEVHRFWTNRWHTHGRYVAFAVEASGPYVFVDELEVYEGSPGWTKERLTGPASSDLPSFQARWVRQRRQAADWELLHALVAQSKINDREKQRLTAELDRLKAQFPTASPEVRTSNTAPALPYGSWHERLFAIRARLWRAQGQPEFAAWVSPSGATPYLAELGDRPTAAARVELSRPAIVSLMNAHSRTIHVTARVEGLPATVATLVSIHRFVWSETPYGKVAIDAAPEPAHPEDKVRAEIPAGMAGQFRLELRPPAILAPGEHHGRLLLKTDAGERVELPITVIIPSPA